MAVSEASLAKVRSRRKCLKTSKKTKIIAIIAIISLLVIGGVIAAILLLCKSVLHFEYRTRAIITQGLYTFYPIFEDQKCFLRSFYRRILTLCTVSIQEWFMIKSGL
jgi:hypothetical protein